MRDVAVGVASAPMSHPPIALPIDRTSTAAGAIPVVVLGTDVVLAALPATAVQLAQACRSAGYASAVPLSWGEELVAHACLEELATRTGPAVCAACPLARERLRASGAPPARAVVPLAPPPAATARYLRRLAGATPLHITYVGGCPGGRDAAIDAQIAPDAFLAALAARDLAPAEQPGVFEDVLPPDRRRFLSLPGGVPAPDALWEVGGRRLVEIAGPDEATQLADLLLSDDPVLVDLAPGQGCVCSGATGAVPARTARLVVAGLEPPRAMRTVVVPGGEGHALPVDGTIAVRAPRALDAGQASAARVAGQEAEGRDADTVSTSDDRAVSPSAPASSAVAGAPPRPHDVADRALPWQPFVAADSHAPRSAHALATRTPSRSPSLSPAGSVGRRTPVGMPRITADRQPLARTEDGRLLPRAYVAHRRSPAAGVAPAGRAVAAPTAPSLVADSPIAPAPAAPAPAAPAGPAAAGLTEDDWFDMWEEEEASGTSADLPTNAVPRDATSRETSSLDAAAMALRDLVPTRDREVNRPVEGVGDRSAPTTTPPTTPTVPVGLSSLTGARATPAGSPVVGSIGPAMPPATTPAGDDWRARLDEAIATWRRLGFRTAVLERARALPHRPDVEGLLGAYAAAVERLRALEAAAVERRPELRGAPAFHDPERVGVAQTLVDALLGSARRG